MGMAVGEHYQEFVITGFELLVADGGGRRDDHCAYVASEEDAKAWVSQSKGWRSYQPFRKVYRIAHNLQGLEALKVEAERDRALAKLTPRERELLGL